MFDRRPVRAHSPAIPLPIGKRIVTASAEASLPFTTVQSVPFSTKKTLARSQLNTEHAIIAILRMIFLTSSSREAVPSILAMFMRSTLTASERTMRRRMRWW